MDNEKVFTEEQWLNRCREALIAFKGRNNGDWLLGDEEVNFYGKLVLGLLSLKEDEAKAGIKTPNGKTKVNNG